MTGIIKEEHTSATRKSMHSIIAATCRVCGVTEEQLTGTGRKAPVLLARRVCVVVARWHGHSFPAIARAMKGDGHSTAIDQHRAAYSPANWPMVAPLAGRVNRMEAKSA